MHIFFSGIGGTGIGPLALIAYQAGFEVSGSDKQDSLYISYLHDRGVTDVQIGQTYEQIAAVHKERPIDWFVYTSALPIEQPDAPELRFCADQHIKATKRDVFLSHLLDEKNLKLLAVAGTHGKTTTTAMAIWAAHQLDLPVSYSVGAKLTFGEMGSYEPGSEYFIYEADEYDRNFLSFNPELAIITGLDWDHQDIYPTQDIYNEAFRTFLTQSRGAILWQPDIERLAIEPTASQVVLDPENPAIAESLQLVGVVNRQDAWQVAQALHTLMGVPVEKVITVLNDFPGVARRFERILPNLYTDYAHTPPKIRGALETAYEVGGFNVVVVYEGLHNTRQHFIKDELVHLFDSTKELYIVPSYLAREDPNLSLLTPSDLRSIMSPEIQAKTTPSQLDDALADAIRSHLADGDLVLCISAGGGHSLDEWLRKTFKQSDK